MIGDVIQNVLLRVRPYEKVPGSAQRLYEKWDGIAAEFFADGVYTFTAVPGATRSADAPIEGEVVGEVA